MTATEKLKMNAERQVPATCGFDSSPDIKVVFVINEPGNRMRHGLMTAETR
jgi:hypothetical protein